MKIQRLLFAATVLISFSSCSRYYYKPNGINTPMFTDGGQVHLNLAGSSGGDGDNNYGEDENTYFFDVQAAVSPVKHFGIIANYSTYAYRVDVPDPQNGYVDADAHLLEVGAGAYNSFGTGKFKLVADIYGGYGGGNIKSDVNMKVNRFFLQPGIGVRSPWFDASFNMRVVNVGYSGFDANGRDNQYLQDHDLIDQRGRRIDSRRYFFAEPGITVRAGYKFAKVQLQAVFANEISQVPFNYNGARFTAGFYMSFEELFRKKD